MKYSLYREVPKDLFEGRIINLDFVITFDVTLLAIFIAFESYIVDDTKEYSVT